jgi:flagellar hook assembly protein FlgD
MNNDLYNSGLYHGPSRAGVDPGKKEVLPVKVSLAGYPNPAVSAVGIRLGVPSTQANEVFSVDVFDVRGRHLRQVHSGELEPGFHEFHWNGRNETDAEVSSGIYFVKVSWKRDSLSRKIVMVR